MLPAKFSGFASRVGRLALRALSWHKTGERDGALNATSSNATVSSATSSSDASNYVCNFADSESSFRTARPARPSRTFRRALFAMLVASATLFATFVVPPVHNANAAKVYWDYAGYGYVSSNNNYIWKAPLLIDLQKPVIEDNNDGRWKVTWIVYFGLPQMSHIGYSVNPMAPVQKKLSPEEHSWETRTFFYMWLPKELDYNNTYIKRYKTGRTIGKEVKFTDFAPVKTDKGIGPLGRKITDFAGQTRWTYTPNDNTKWSDEWVNQSIGDGQNGCGPNENSEYNNEITHEKYSRCEMQKWYNNGNFGRVIISYESSEYNFAHKWVLTSFIDKNSGINFDSLPVIAGYRSGTGNDADSKNMYAVLGPYDTDGDGYPDVLEYKNGTNPTKADDFKHWPIDDAMPFTVSESKGYFPTGEWEGTSTKGHFVYFRDKNGKEVPSYNIPKGMQFKIDKPATFGPFGTGQNAGVIMDGGSVPPSNLKPNHAWLNPSNGDIKFNPDKGKYGKYKFYITAIYPDPSQYHCNQTQKRFTHDAEFTVWPMSHYFKPKYDQTTVEAGKEEASPKPKNIGTKKLKGREFPDGTTFTVKKNPEAWAKIENNDKNNGVIHFTPNKLTNPKKYSIPVKVTYPDGSTSDDSMSSGLVNAPVTVVEPKIGNDDMHLDLHFGNGLHDENIGGYYNDSNLAHLKKNNPIDKNDNKKGVVLDSWSTNAKGKIDFRAICHKEDSAGKKSGYKFLKPAKGKEKAEGDIAGLKFMDFHQWGYSTEEQEKECNKNNSCSANPFKYNYLTINQRNSNTMERSRALIGGEPNKGGDYVCKVFAFHENDTTLNNFDKNKVAPDILDSYAGDSKKTAIKTFKFHVDVPDNQKYNPTYVKMPTIQAGSTYNKNLNNHKADISSDAPQSKKKVTEGGTEVNANGVPKEDLVDVKEGALPAGTWYEIKRFVKAGDIKNLKVGSLPWANFEDGEDNVKRKSDGSPELKDGKKQQDRKDATGKGSVTFRPDKWQDKGEYWAEIRVHYPDGSVSDGDHSINKNHPVYAKVKVTRDDGNNQLYLVLYKNYSPPTYERIPANGYDLKVGDSLPNDATFDSWMTKSVGKLHQHVICSKKGTDGKYGDYTYNTLPGHFDKKDKNAKKDEKDGLRFKSQKIWDHASFKQQEQCRADSKKCDKNNYLYDSDGASEQTRGYFGGKAQKTGDYQCKVYVISGKDKSKSFENAVKANIKKSTSKDPAAGLFDKKDNNYPYGEDGKGYKTGSFEVRIHNDNHFYNPKYVDVSVTAGQKVENAVPQSVRSANGADKSQDAVKAGALPDGTWFEFKDAANGFEVNADGTAGNKVALDWSYWAGNAADSAGDQSNKPDNPSKQKKGKHSANGDGTRYGKVTFHPDQSVAPKAYLKEIVIHYPDGSTSDDSDSGNNGKPVYAKVTVGGLGQKSNLQLKLYKDKDPQTGEPMNGELNDRLYVMNDISLLRKPFIRTWSLTSKNKLNLRMLCHKDGTGGNWTSDENQSVVYIPGNGSKSTQWNFANEAQQRNCRERGNCNAAHTLYGFINDPNDVNSVHNALARTEDIVDGAPKQTGDYSCTVFTLDDAALKRFNDLAANNTFMSNPYNSGARDLMNNNSLKQGTNWDRLTFYITVVEKFALPKTGGEGMSMALLVVAMICMCVMCGAFFVDQTKWGHAMLAGAAAGMMGGLRSATRNSNSKISEIWRGLVKKVKDIRRFDDYSASAKDFVRKATGWLRAAFRRVRRWATERWRC